MIADYDDAKRVLTLTVDLGDAEPIEVATGTLLDALVDEARDHIATVLDGLLHAELDREAWDETARDLGRL